MADTVDLNNITEYHDSAEELEQKVKELATLVRGSQHVIFFTGAGISTSAQIPDFRGPNGVWTRQAQGGPAPGGVKITQATPTLCHMALAELVHRGTAKYIVSQNIDGLHRRSGIPADRISELHGNCYLELCWECNTEYLRTFDVSEFGGVGGTGCPVCLKRVPHFCHCTARRCACGQRLKDSIIHFRENLPVDALAKGFDHAAKADLCIVLGSSLTVSPACHIPRDVEKNGGKLVIVNLQATPYDGRACLRLHAKTDEVMAGLMGELGLAFPSFEASPAFAAEQVRLADGAAAAAAAARDHSEELLANLEAVHEAQNAFPGVRPTGGVDRMLANEDRGGYVNPKEDCPHLAAHLSAHPIRLGTAQSALAAGCAECEDTSENWICMQCHDVFCSRYVKEHMMVHSATSEHLIATSLRDLNTWCYGCSSYIKARELAQATGVLYLAKHGELPVELAQRR
eukprot:gnl/Hemi2/28544_TR9457_c0_g1_i1.p1 gnl/Hemi2/28544_TR9457_c0_g1~~gnl/Hemi2/28544_TR9457_c0_g1_i1.p1  ORF type:complete len:458 (-),score=132.97 gnl/Hemi2/28544_TR9457_c0_g1_i1:220-1593(-)